MYEYCQPPPPPVGGVRAMKLGGDAVVDLGVVEMAVAGI